MRVKRWDVGQLSEPKRLDNGYLQADGYITRTGVFTYRLADGSERREWRPPEEVFDSASLQSFTLVPLTNEHPPVQLDASNTKEFQTGTVSNLVPDAPYVRALIQVTDEAAIGDAVGGKRELSCGYSCELDFSPGVSPDGEKYDAVQKSIRGNHVALVDRGRAGPAVALRLDAEDGVIMSTGGSQATAKEEPQLALPLATVRVDGVERAIERLEAELAAARTEIETLKAARDNASERADAAESKVSEMLTEEQVAARVKNRVALECAAASHLGDRSGWADSSDVDLMKAVVAKASPKAALDEATEEYIRARFDAALEMLDAGRVKPSHRVRVADAGIEDNSAEAARARMIARNRAQWQQKPHN